MLKFKKNKLFGLAFLLLQSNCKVQGFQRQQAVLMSHNNNQSLYDKVPALESVFAKVDEFQDQFLHRLSGLIAIPAVSGEEARRSDVIRKGNTIKDELVRLGFTDVKLKDLGEQRPGLQLPPVVLGRYGSDPKKKTVLVYAHYDVQPAEKSDGWDTEPFEMYIDKDADLLRGRGVTDDTGPLTGWLNVIDAYKAAGKELPVNLITCFEGMEESGSIGLEGLIELEAENYFKGVDTVCISDNYWLGTKKPVLTYGLRGVQYYQIAISGPAADLHSGLFGGAVAEPMIDLTHVLSSLVDSKGNILIEGINEMVPEPTKTERDLYDQIDFSVADMEAAIGSKTCLYNNTQELLLHRWRYPSLSIHGVEGAFYGNGEKTVIPAKTIGKFSIRTVPDMDSAKVDSLVVEHCNKVFKSLNSPNTCVVNPSHSGPYWLSDPFNAPFSAASKAIQLVFGVEPDFTREGGSIPITISFEQLLKTNVLLLPMGRGDDGAHSINEKLDLSNYYNGTKAMAAFLEFYALSEKS